MYITARNMPWVIYFNYVNKIGDISWRIQNSKSNSSYTPIATLQFFDGDENSVTKVNKQKPFNEHSRPNRKRLFPVRKLVTIIRKVKNVGLFVQSWYIPSINL